MLHPSLRRHREVAHRALGERPELPGPLPVDRNRDFQKSDRLLSQDFFRPKLKSK